MRFLGRAAELKALTGVYGSAKSGFVPIYGRRRIGKSALILKFLENNRAIYFVGKQAPAELQQREFVRLCAHRFQQPLLAEVAGSWSKILSHVDRQIEESSEKWVIALDEFQWMVGESPELPSILQELWDRKWSKNNKVVLILCGSYIGFMEKEVLGRKSPLFGRRTAQIQLQPFPHREAALFHPHESLKNRAKIFFICGGVPQYLERFSTGGSVEESIRSELLDEFSPLYREPDFLLREELRELPRYFAILMALSRGSSTAPEIAKLTGVAERSAPYYLNQLCELGYVRKRHPVTDGAPSVRKVRYQLCDPLLRFWFRFVYPNQSQIRQLDPAIAFARLIKPQLTSYFGECFETLCQQALSERYAQQGVQGFQVGEYWDKKVQIDIVGWRQDDRTDLGECKWGQVRSLSSLRRELEQKCNLYPNKRGATLGRVLFLRQWEGERPDGVQILTLDDIYG